MQRYRDQELAGQRQLLLSTVLGWRCGVLLSQMVDFADTCKYIGVQQYIGVHRRRITQPHHKYPQLQAYAFEDKPGHHEHQSTSSEDTSATHVVSPVFGSHGAPVGLMRLLLVVQSI